MEDFLEGMLFVLNLKETGISQAGGRWGEGIEGHSRQSMQNIQMQRGMAAQVRFRIFKIYSC